MINKNAIAVLVFDRDGFGLRLISLDWYKLYLQDGLYTINQLTSI